jgi:hypothetical protein
MRFGMTEVFGYLPLMRAFRGETEGVAEGVAAMRASAGVHRPAISADDGLIDAAVARSPRAVSSRRPRLCRRTSTIRPTAAGRRHDRAAPVAARLARARRALAGWMGPDPGRLFDAGRRAVQAGVAALEAHVEAQVGPRRPPAISATSACRSWRSLSSTCWRPVLTGRWASSVHRGLRS